MESGRGSLFTPLICTTEGLIVARLCLSYASLEGCFARLNKNILLFLYTIQVFHEYLLIAFFLFELNFSLCSFALKYFSLSIIEFFALQRLTDAV